MLTILTYHHIGILPENDREAGLFVSPEAFDAQLGILRNRKIPVLSLDEARIGLLGEGPLPPHATVITIDDGYEDNYTRAFPILQKYGLRAVFFSITDKIGQCDNQGRTHMDAEQLRELAAAGMTVGSHTVSHPWLAKMPAHAARRELEESKEALESILQESVRWLCYPRGSFNRDVAEMAKETGYLGACSVIRDNRVSAEQLYYLPRVMVMPDATPLRFRYYFSGLYHLIHARKNRKRWRQYL